MAVKVDKKQWNSIRNWLLKLHPSIRLKYLKLIFEAASREIKENVETLIRDAEGELVSSPEWKQFGRPAPAEVKLEELFPALAGPGEEEKSLERRLASLLPAEIKKEEAERGIDIYKPSPKEFETEYKALPAGGYQEARQDIKELYEKVTGLYERSKTEGVAPEEVKKIQRDARPVLLDAVRVAGGRSTSSEVYRRMLVRTEQMMRTMQGMSERSSYEMETYTRHEREDGKYASS